MMDMDFGEGQKCSSVDKSMLTVWADYILAAAIL